MRSLAIGGLPITTTVEGRNRFTVNVRYPQDLRSDPERLREVLVPARTDQTLMVIDGVKLNDPASADGSFNFGDLLLGDVDHVEVLRGPQSTLWGGQAMGGVVAVTRSFHLRAPGSSSAVTFGSHGSTRSAAGR